jgi:ferredoxin-type protein NapG
MGDVHNSEQMPAPDDAVKAGTGQASSEPAAHAAQVSAAQASSESTAPAAQVGAAQASVATQTDSTQSKHKTTTFTRRGVICGAVGAVALLALGCVDIVSSEALVRPPGAQDEDMLLATCIRCQKCMEVCPQNAINITHIENGLLQARLPKMDFHLGWCNFCEDVNGGPRCAAVCPTGAIAKIDSPTVTIGVAQLTREWCLAYRGTGCHSCQDACTYNAITLDADHVPVVNESVCNGCGACENACISLSAGSLSGTWDSSHPTDRAITVKPLEGNQVQASKDAQTNEQSSTKR